MKEFDDRRNGPRQRLNAGQLGLIPLQTLEGHSPDRRAHLPETLFVTILDRSENGLLLESPYPLSSDAPIELLTGDFQHKQTRIFLGTVRWTKALPKSPPAFLIGMQVSRPENAELLLTDFKRIQKSSGWSDLQLLVHTDFLQDLPVALLTPLLNSLSLLKLQEGKRLIRQGEPGDCLYIIRSGSCLVLLEKETRLHRLARLGKGDIVGEMSVLTRATRSAHVDAETPLTLWRLTREDFDWLTSYYPDLRVLLTDLIIRRISGSMLREEGNRDRCDRLRAEVFQYFEKEFFQKLAPDQQRFLIRSASLEKLNSGSGRYLDPNIDTVSLMKALSEDHAFIQPYPDAEGGIHYGYHPAFRDYLKSKQNQILDHDQKHRLYIAIGGYLSRIGRLEEALDHYLQAGAFKPAVRLLRKIGLILIRQGRYPELSGRLAALPADLRESDPWLILLGVLGRRFLSGGQNIRDLRKAADWFRARNDRPGLLLALGFLLEEEIFGGKFDHRHLVESEALLRTIRPEERSYESALLQARIGLVHSTRKNPRDGFWACQDAYLDGVRYRDPLLQALALIHGITCLTLLGEYQEADRLFQIVEGILSRHSFPDLHLLARISRMLTLAFRGLTRDSLDLGKSVSKELEAGGLVHLHPLLLYYRQIVLVHDRQYDAADLLGKKLFRMADTNAQPYWRAMALFNEALSAYWSNHPSKAGKRIAEALEYFSREDSRSDLHALAARLIQCLLNHRSSERTSVIETLESLLRQGLEMENYILIIECRLALGICCKEAGDHEAAGEHLRKGFDLIRERETGHFIILSPGDVIRACFIALQLGPFQSGETASRLLTGPYARDARSFLLQPGTAGDLPEPDRLREVRRRLHRSTVPRLRIATFGGLRVYRGGAAMTEEDWDRLQPRRLLTAILAKRQSPIPKELLIEDLWPEEPPAVGENNLKTTLRRLRNSLEAEVSREFGSSYIHLHHNLIFLDEELCRYDVRDFLSLLDKGKRKEKSGEIGKALDCFSHALDLYQDDFLPEVIYDPWVVERREELKAAYLDLLERMSRHYEHQGQTRKAIAQLQKMITADPLFEDAYRRLMTIYADKGLQTEAIRVFQTCQKALREGLNTPPDFVTLSLFERIREKNKKIKSRPGTNF